MASIIYPDKRQPLRPGEIFHTLVPIIVATVAECEQTWGTSRTSWHTVGRIARDALVVMILDREESRAWLAVKDGFWPLDLGTRLGTAHQEAARFGLTLDWTFKDLEDGSRMLWPGSYSPRRVGEVFPPAPPLLRENDRELFDQLRTEATARPGAIDPRFFKTMKPVGRRCDENDPEDVPRCQGGVYRVLIWNEDERRLFHLGLKHAFDEWAPGTSGPEDDETW